MKTIPMGEMLIVGEPESSEKGLIIKLRKDRFVWCEVLSVGRLVTSVVEGDMVLVPAGNAVMVNGSRLYRERDVILKRCSS